MMEILSSKEELSIKNLFLECGIVPLVDLLFLEKRQRKAWFVSSRKNLESTFVKMNLV